ncbi:MULTISPECIES: hypothetical protein [unclassified Psychrobacter]|uniref:hypothetical protein n=1 Tax=unclassified Psychrobacter TaxID=196806 RepID=UPI003FB96FA2
MQAGFAPVGGGGEFTTRIISQYTKTQAWLLEQFLPAQITFDTINNNQTLVRIIC